MRALGYSPAEAYAVLLAGDDLAHLTQLVDDREGMHGEYCAHCKRIQRAVAVAQFVGPVEGPLSLEIGR